jgi:hypothetical protein
MLRKFGFALMATISLSIAALAPTSASAFGGHIGHHMGHHNFRFHGPRFFIGGPYYYGGYDGCYVRRLVPSPWGLRWRLVNRCY